MKLELIGHTEEYAVSQLQMALFPAAWEGVCKESSVRLNELTADILIPPIAYIFPVTEKSKIILCKG